MIGKYHTSITEEALNQPFSTTSTTSKTDPTLTKIFSSAAVDAIVQGNLDSDKKGSELTSNKNIQHSNHSTIEECGNFIKQTEQIVIDDFIKAAEISDDNKDDESYKQAFYDLGRLDHSIQDFYSHSNWINQTGNKEAVWDETSSDKQLTNPEKLKTGEYDWWSQLGDATQHIAGGILKAINPFNWFKSKKKKEKEKEEKYDKTYIETSAQSHYILNKDKPKTIADKAFKAQEGVSGFDLACKDATSHTAQKWQEILDALDEKLDDVTYNELLDDLKNFETTNTSNNEETQTIEDYRTKFDEKIND